METWKPVMGYEGIYDVSDCGNVRRVAYFDAMSKGHHTLLKNMKHSNGKAGYHRIKLMNHGKASIKLIHRLVAQAFIDNPFRLPCVNHIDGNKSNNHVSNLQWCTHKENNAHAARNNLRMMKNKKGSYPVGMYSLQTGELLKTFPSSHEASRATGLAQAHIWECCAGKRKYAYGYAWKWLPVP